MTRVAPQQSDDVGCTRGSESEGLVSHRRSHVRSIGQHTRKFFDHRSDQVAATVADAIEYNQHDWSNLQDAEHQIVPITLSSACQRLGHFLDLWYTDASEAIAVIRSDPKLFPFPLAGLFKTEFECNTKLTKGQDQGHDSSRDLYSSTEAQFEVGGIVKAPMHRELRSLREEIRYEETHVDLKSEWSTAVLKQRGQGCEWDVEWEEFSSMERSENENVYEKYQSLKKSNPQCFKVQVQERNYIPDLTGEHEIAGNDVIRDLTPFFFFGSGVKIFLLFVVRAVVVFIIPDVVMLQRQNLCAESNEVTDFLCEEDGYELADSIFDKYFCYLVGLFSIITSYVFSQVLPCCYVVFSRLSSRHAKITRKILVNILLDPFLTQYLSDVNGWIQTACLVAFYSLYVSGLIVAIVRINGGLFPLAHILVQLGSQVMNVFLGEPRGMRRVRAEQILSVLDEHAKANYINISYEQLKNELTDFLSTPPNAGVVVVSLPFLTVMAHAIYSREPFDSVRMRRFVVTRAYAEYRHKPKTLAKQIGSRKDVIVDLFASTCRVPTCSLVGEKWMEKKRCAFPWHFALKLWKVPEIEMKLRLQNLRAGEGCFTWRSTRNGLWATREAEDVKTFEASTKKSASRMEEVSVGLSMMTLDPTYQHLQQIKPLLDAHADVNFSWVGEPALFRAIRQGKAEIAKALVSYRADLTLTCARHDGKSPLEIISKEHETRFQEFKKLAHKEIKRNKHSQPSMFQKRVDEVLFFEVAGTGSEDGKSSLESSLPSFPQALSPFRLHQTDKIKAAHLLLAPEDGDASTLTKWNLASPVIESVFGEKKKSLHVTMSTISELTLSLDQRRKTNIPDDVVRFAWCNPVRDKTLATVESLVPDANCNPDFCFLLAGGFVYFADEEGRNKPKAILAPLLSKAGGGAYLNFQSPKKYRVSEFLDAVNAPSKILEDFKDITLQSAKDAGYSKFAWLHADAWRHRSYERGGFAYIASRVDLSDLPPPLPPDPPPLPPPSSPPAPPHPPPLFH